MKNYTTPELSIITFDSEDVITVSPVTVDLPTFNLEEEK
jgi:hypothetical protein